MLSPTPSIDRPSMHPGTSYLVGPRVPHGLAAVVEGLTREVLRQRPEDICVFAAHYFEKLLRLREQYHAEEYGSREFDGAFGREFNLWPGNKHAETRGSSIRGWSLEKEIEILEKCKKMRAEAAGSAEDLSACTDKEHPKISKETSVRGLAKRAPKKSAKGNETTSDPRATRMISQMSATSHGNSKYIRTKDIKQELRRNKLNGEDTLRKTIDSAEKGIRGDGRSSTRVAKPDKDAEKKTKYAATTTTTTTSSKASTLKKRPLKKVRRIETESETETEREAAASDVRSENGYERSSTKGENACHEAATAAMATATTTAAAAQLSERFPERKVSSRALSMDRIRAYVLRKFASTASLEVLCSPTYVEQVQEVIDRTAPIIKEKLEEMKRPRGKRSRSVDLAWNEELVDRHTRDGRERERESKEKRKDRLESEADTAIDAEETEDRPSTRRNETILSVDRKETKCKECSARSGKKLKKRASGSRDDFALVSGVDDDSKRDKSDREFGAQHDTLETRLTITQNILQEISKPLESEPDSDRRIDPAYGGQESSESEVTDHVNVVSLPIVRPPSSKNGSRNAKNGSDSITLPPISPEAPKSTKKRDELSLPVLPAATTNGSYSARKSQEQEDSKDAEEASTMRDITSDMEDTAVLPEDEYEDAGAKFVTLEKEKDGGLEERVSDASFDSHLQAFENLIELEDVRTEEVFKDSLNVTPEVIDMPPRPDSLELDKDEQMRPLEENDADAIARDDALDGLKSKLIEIEMAERSIEKVLVGQGIAMHDDEAKAEAETFKADWKISERDSVSETKQIVNEMGKSKREVSNERGKSTSETEPTNEAKEPPNGIEELVIKHHVGDVLSANSRTRDEDNWTIEMDARRISSNDDGGDGDDGHVTVTKNEAEKADDSSKTTIHKNAVIESESSNFLNQHGGAAKTREKRESDESPATTPQSSPVPYSYILSEGSPCEIPDSVTTVIIPDRLYPSPVFPEIEERQFGLMSPTSGEERTTVRHAVVEASSSKEEMREMKTRGESGAEAFGEYIHPEAAFLPADMDFACSAKGAKASQSIVIVHQNLDKIKEEREAEGEKRGDDDAERGKDVHRGKADERSVARDERTKLVTLEDIVEREENEETDTKTSLEASVGFNGAEKSLSSYVPVREPVSSTVNLIAGEAEAAEVATELRSTLENSSEESGGSQDTRATTSSNGAKESTASNRSIESPSIDRPIVPELNLDSLQDNTVSSFKITANGTATKGSNDSLRGSDATMSFVEPLTSDESATIGNQLVLADCERDAEELTQTSSRDEKTPEASRTDQLYRMEQAKCERLEKDPSSKIALEEAGLQKKDVTDLKASAEDTARSALRQEDEKLSSEEEIARELISSLDEEMQHRAKQLDSKKGAEESKKPVENDLDHPKDESVRILSVQPTTVGQPDEKKGEVSGISENVDKEIARTNAFGELSDQLASTSQNNKDKDITIKKREIEEIKSQVEEKEHAATRQDASLVQFEQDKFLEREDGQKKSDIIDIDSLNNREKIEDQKTSVEEALKNQNNENANKMEEYCEKRKRGESEDKEETREQEKTPDGSDRSRSISRDELFADDRTKEDAENGEKEKIKDSPVKVESVHGPITNAISERSMEDCFHDRHWTAERKSSTVETVIAAFAPKTSMNEDKMETFDAFKTPETDKSESSKKNDLYLAAIKIQACTRGFLTRKRMQKNLSSEPILNDISSASKPSHHLVVPEDVRPSSRDIKVGSRQRLRREEALRKTTLSLENAFVVGRLQHTSEFHDSVPLSLFDTASKEISVPLNESLDAQLEENTQTRPDVAKSGSNDGSHDDESRMRNFPKNSVFVDHSTFPIVMHLLTDVSRNCRVNRNPNQDFDPSVEETKSADRTMDILMLGYPRDDSDEATLQNRYLNFITSVEDNADPVVSLSLGDAIGSSKSADKVHPSVASSESSLREPLALPGTPQGIVIEELTSLDEAIGDTSSTKSGSKPSIASGTSRDINSSMPERRVVEDERNDSEMSSRTSQAGKSNEEADKERMPIERNIEAQSRDEDRINVSRGSNGHTNVSE